MRRTAAVTACLLLLCSWAFAQETAALKGATLTGPHHPFTITCPEGWQHEAIESKTTKPAEEFELKVSVFGDPYFPTDNFNLWWYDGKLDAMEKGAISVHRVELPREVAADQLIAEMKKDKRFPEDATSKLTQFGKYAGVLMADKPEDFMMHGVYIVNGKVAYVGELMGPKEAVTKQADTFVAIMSSLDAGTDVKASRVDGLKAGGEEKKPAEELLPGQIKAKNSDFTLQLPEGWQYSAYDDPNSKPNGKLIMQAVGALGQVKFTDNFNFWWDPAGENMMKGLASLHRLEVETGMDARTLVAAIQGSGKLPPGMQANVAQVGNYNAALIGGPFQMFYVAVAVIPQGNTAYVGAIMGPQAVVTPQWPNFIKLVGSIKAPDLKPDKAQ